MTIIYYFTCCLTGGGGRKGKCLKYNNNNNNQKFLSKRKFKKKYSKDHFSILSNPKLLSIYLKVDNLFFIHVTYPSKKG